MSPGPGPGGSGMSMGPVPDGRGTALFTPEALDRIIQTTVVPQVPQNHSLAVVATANDHGVSAGLLFRKDTSLGDWTVEASWAHTFAGDDQLGTKLVWSI